MHKIDKSKIGSHEMCNATANEVIPRVNELIGLLEALTERVSALESQGSTKAAPKAKALEKAAETAPARRKRSTAKSLS